MSAPSSDLTCDNCGESHAADDIFCENCGYDFITGSLPRPDEVVGPDPAVAAAPAASAASPDSPSSPASAPSAPAPSLPLLSFEVIVDEAYFAAVVADGELEFPDPPPTDQVVELSTTEVHIGRTSNSRGIHPDLDIAALTEDPAVSSRHALIRVDSDGGLTITDVGSTNGTFVGAVDAEAIKPDAPTPFDRGTPLYLGAWTKLVVKPA